MNRMNSKQTSLHLGGDILSSKGVLSGSILIGGWGNCCCSCCFAFGKVGTASHGFWTFTIGYFRV